MQPGPDVRLRRLELLDIYILRQWRNNPKIWKWCRQYDLISEVDQERWFEKQASDPSISMYGVCDQHGHLIGVCGFTSIDLINRRAEFSLYIAPDKHGNGYGKKALLALFSHGFMNFGLNCIWGETFENNPAINLFESIGMKQEGTRRDFYYRDGHFIGAHLYSLLRPEWDRWLSGGIKVIPISSGVTETDIVDQCFPVALEP